MADSELEKIRKLPPKQRLELLKALKKRKAEEKKKKELLEKKEAEEAKKILEQSLSEIKLDEMLQEIEVPKPEDVEVEKLLEQKTFEEDIKLGKIKLEGGSNYGKKLQELMSSAQNEVIQQWYAQDSPPPTEDEFFEAYDAAREAYNNIAEQMGSASNSYKAGSEQAMEEASSSLKMLRALGYKHNIFNGP